MGILAVFVDQASLAGIVQSHSPGPDFECLVMIWMQFPNLGMTRRIWFIWTCYTLEIESLI